MWRDLTGPAASVPGNAHDHRMPQHLVLAVENCRSLQRNRKQSRRLMRLFQVGDAKGNDTFSLNHAHYV
jgi:hypothetical protein